jgi:transcription elongation factor GreB
MGTGTRPITPRGYQKYKEELERLWHVDRPKIVQEVSDAAALGDRSENAEYIYGKKKMREIDRRIEFLSKLMDKLQVIDPKEVSYDRVKFGATVVIEDEEGVEKTYQIVGEDEVDAKVGHISTVSPMGRALLNRKVGDSVLVNRPAGELEVTVIDIRYE